MRTHVAEPWVEAPLQGFVDDARVLFALLLHPSGQVMGQFGFTRAVDVMAACALAAGIHASAGQLGRELDGQPFRELYHAGRDRQIFIGEVR
ncbi:MAG TPA: roadblock/LC7 domain-containing protein, partial [Gemmatimonadaceae bacterium]|nr:roadblock/LC7 domain-containing protein [Gemmatimonadaceae bacterium]